MSMTRLVRTLRAAAVPVLAGTALAGLVTLGEPNTAQAAASHPALHVTGTVRLGPADSAFALYPGEAPDGALYYSLGGRQVYVVRPGSTRAALAVTASSPVLAVAANSSELFVAAGRTVTGYSRTSGRAERQWRLPGLTPTEVGLYPVGSTVWAMTDWATDESGFEYASVDWFATTSGTVHTVSANNAYPLDAAADADGLYYEMVNGQGVNGYLVRVTASGTLHRVTDVNLDAPLALAGGRVTLLAVHSDSLPYLDSYNQVTLARTYSRRAFSDAAGIAGTGAGLLLLTVPCQSAGACSSATVSQLSTATGGTIASAKIPGATTLVPGPATYVITFKGGVFYLVRLAA